MYLYTRNMHMYKCAVTQIDTYVFVQRFGQCAETRSFGHSIAFCGTSTNLVSRNGHRRWAQVLGGAAVTGNIF